SARGTNAATLSTTPTSTAPDRTNNSTISNACSPVSGCDTNNCSTSTPNAAAYTGSKACSASTNAATPPERCASATTCKAKVVFPPDSGPYTSTTRPRGNPPTPNARSTLNDPVETTPAPNTPAGSAPNRMISPLPNCLSIAETADFSACSRSFNMTSLSFLTRYIAPYFHLKYYGARRLRARAYGRVPLGKRRIGSDTRRLRDARSPGTEAVRPAGLI